MGGSSEVYTNLDQRRMFSYANVRKAAYRGRKTMMNIPVVLTINLISVYKFGVIWGVFLLWFTDSMLFSMMVKTEFQDGVDSHQDLIDRDMAMGIVYRVREPAKKEKKSVFKKTLKGFDLSLSPRLSFFTTYFFKLLAS